MNSMEAVWAQIVTAFGEDLKRCMSRLEADGPPTVEGLEEAVGELRASVGQQVAERVWPLLSRYEEKPRCATCGTLMGCHELREVPVLSLLGRVGLRMRRYRCGGCGAEATPGLVAARLRCGCSTQVAALAARLGATMTYREAEAELAGRGLLLSDSSVEALTSALGGERYAAQRAEADAVWAGQVDLTPSTPPTTLVLMTDGYQVEHRDTWHEARVGVCYETDGSCPDAQGRAPAPQRVSCCSAPLTVDEFIPLFYAQAQRRGVTVADTVVIVGDGAAWIWAHVPDFVPPGRRKVEILDFYHAAEHLAEAARAVLGEGTPDFTKYFQRLRTAARAGHIATVLKLLDRLRKRAGGDALKVVEGTLAYVERHRKRMDYGRFRRRGYPIGSGMVESHCKQLGERVKGRGKRWRQDHLAAVLALRCDYLNETRLQRAA